MAKQSKLLFGTQSFMTKQLTSLFNLQSLLTKKNYTLNIFFEYP